MKKGIFKSFWMAGFECATGLNRNGEWIDQVAATGHDRLVDRDYAALAAAGLSTVREGIRWPLADRGRRLDFSSVEPFCAAANRHEIQVIWDLFHYGYPPDLDPFEDMFVERFAAYCHEAALFLKRRMEGPLLITPVNEPSYLAWAGGEACEFAPHLCGKAYELKSQLVRAAIAGTNAFWSVCPDAQVVTADPVCRQATPRDRPDLEEGVRRFNEVAVFEALDMLSGRLLPELGGSPRHLGVVGINYYWTNQWEAGKPKEPLAMDDERAWSLSDIMRWTWHRYRCDLAITETSHAGASRAPWMRYVATEAAKLLREGVPLCGICLYPILGMPEWHERSRWTKMGLWDVDRGGNRRLYKPLYQALAKAREQIEAVEAGRALVRT